LVNKYVILPAIAAAVAIAGVVIGASLANNAPSPEVSSDATQSNANEQPESIPDLFSGGSPVLGSQDASLTLVEFGDYQCMNCNRHFKNTEHLILQNYVETGKVKVIFVDFAFIGPDSIKAAQAAHCAQDQGKYWEYHDETYSNWDGENTGWASVGNLKKFAANINLDQNQFDKCLDSGKYAQKVKDNYSLGEKFGVTGTPTFLIIDSSGQAVKVVGAQPYSVLSQVIDSRMKL
jgi:protein-disulfide isomerase